MISVSTVPGAGPVFERLWEFVRSNPDAVADMLRAAKRGFTSPPRPPEPPPEPPPPPPPDPRVSDLEANLEHTRASLAAIEARANDAQTRVTSLAGRLDRADAELARFSRDARNLRRMLIAAGALIVLLFAVLFYLSAAHR